MMTVFSGSPDENSVLERRLICASVSTMQDMSLLRIAGVAMLSQRALTGDDHHT